MPGTVGKPEQTRAESPPCGEVEFAELWRPTDGGVAPRGPEKILLEKGRITPAQLEKARAFRQENPTFSVLDCLVQGKAIDEIDALQAVAGYFKLPFARLASGDVEEMVFGALPVEYMRAKKVLPIRSQNGAIMVGITDPADIFLIDDVKQRLRAKVSLTVVPPSDILRIIEERSATPSQQVDEIIKDIADDSVELLQDHKEEVTDLEKIAGESPVIRYVNYLISSAVRDGVSDIHIEPGEDRLRIRWRIDGILFEQQAPPLAMHAAIVSRLKIMANMDIAERRLPQDGRIRATVYGRAVDLRVSTLPITHGEKCVMRILDNRSIMVGMEQLGMLPDTLEAFRSQILQPHGIVLVTGPTGSGKSTTLYSALRVMEGDKLNISTVEDPVEYELSFANQVGVHESIGLTFSAALRSLLRQDPDVIMVGEIRDAETARIAIQASLTGHMVLSTLHTNDAPSSVTRLINIGIEPFLLAASVNACVAQRLVRRICEKCKTPMPVLREHEAVYLKNCGIDVKTVFHGSGCEKCRHTGYKGRLGIYEMMEFSDELRQLISSNPSVTDLRAVARKNGMRTLRDDGLAKVVAGWTTVEEIMRVTET